MALSTLLFQKCPRCNKGKLFTGVFKMHEKCSHCHLKFDREEGYYTMAIVFANFMYALIVAPTLLILTAKDKSYTEIGAILAGISIVAVPVIFRYARTIWLHFDFFIHPE
jgi:hypothetical protein